MPLQSQSPLGVVVPRVVLLDALAPDSVVDVEVVHMHVVVGLVAVEIGVVN